MDVSFGPYRLLAAQRLLLEGDKPVRLGSRAFDILTALVERAGEVVGKEELITRAWPATFVEEANLKIQISALRRALVDGHIPTIVIRPRRSMWCFRTGNGARRAIHGMSLVSVAWYTILRTSCTRCAQQNGPCWRSGSFGQNRSAPDLGGLGCDEAHIAR